MFEIETVESRRENINNIKIKISCQHEPHMCKVMTNNRSYIHAIWDRVSKANFLLIIVKEG